MCARPSADEVREILELLVVRGLLCVDDAELNDPRYFVDPLQLASRLFASRSLCGDDERLELVTDS